jgi:Helix-turn-helix domain
MAEAVRAQSSCTSSRSDPHGRIPCDLLRDPKVSANARVVYGLLQARTDRSGHCWPAHRTLAAELGSSERTVARALDELRQGGWVEWSPRGAGRSLRYRVHGLQGGHTADQPGHACHLSPDTDVHQNFVKEPGPVRTPNSLDTGVHPAGWPADVIEEAMKLDGVDLLTFSQSQYNRWPRRPRLDHIVQARRAETPRATLHRASDHRDDGQAGLQAATHVGPSLHDGIPRLTVAGPDRDEPAVVAGVRRPEGSMTLNDARGPSTTGGSMHQASLPWELTDDAHLAACLTQLAVQVFLGLLREAEEEHRPVA